MMGGRARRYFGAVACLLLANLALAGSLPSAAQSAPRSILVLEESDAVRGPFYASIYAALRQRILSTLVEPVSIYIENLDLVFFSGQAYEQRLQELLLEKYSDRDISVVLAIGIGALDRAVQWRSELWPDVPIVFAVVPDSRTEFLNTLPAVTGRTIRLNLNDMIAAADAVVPSLKHVAVLGEPFDSESAAPFKQFGGALEELSAKLDVLDLTGKPMEELKQRVGALPPNTAILYTPIYSDGAGGFFPAAQALQMIASVANRPIITPLETLVGLGAVGGHALVPSVIGEEAADQVLAILDGQEVATMPVTASLSLRPIFDWRMMRRWQVDEARLPPGSEIRNRPLPIWRQYPVQSAIGIIVMLAQSALIGALVYESARRRRAEAAARARMLELARVNRQTTAGELSTSIAHEINQPLGAALAHTEAAQIVLESSVHDKVLLSDILHDIKRETLRASEIIVRLRRLLKNAPIQIEDIDPNIIIADVFKLVAAQSLEASVKLIHNPSSSRLVVKGDTIQLEQVLLNLIMNSIDAIRLSKVPGSIFVRIGRLNETRMEITVADDGPGIPADKLDHIFDPFFTTKDGGMGMGLSIARTIVEAHGGKLTCENREPRGAKFTLNLPCESSS